MRFIHPPAASSRVEMFEVSKTALAASGRSVSPGGGQARSGGQNLVLPSFHPTTGFTGRSIAPPAAGAKPRDRWLKFTGWELFHAAAKSEMLAHTAAEAEGAAEYLGWLYASSFLWKEGFELVPGAIRKRRKDSGRIALAARVGEGMGHLLMQKFKYVYWDALESLFDRLASKHTGAHPQRVKAARANAPMKGGRQPDFVFEDRAGRVALAECKGHFVKANAQQIPFGESLREGLAQLRGWPGLITPTPQSSFAVNTCVVETDCKVPSFVAFVDPEDEPNDFGLPIGDAIRRGNYAAWLLFMGLPAHAEALRWYGRDPQTRARFDVLQVGRRRYAVAGGPWTRRPWWYWGADPSGTVIAGIDIEVLSAIKGALNGDELPSLPSELREQETERSQVGVEGADGFVGSVMADGTLLGVLHEPRRFVEEESFTL